MTESSTHVPTVIIGAGHAGLATSSLPLLTPNWQSQFPGMSYSGSDPDGYMTMPEVIDFITTYAETISAPVRSNTTVTRVRVHERGYAVDTDRGNWTCNSVIIASGCANIANVPGGSAEVPASVAQFNAMTYRSPRDLDDRAVLVVGASATGVQLADEISRSGRTVTVAVG